MSAAGGTSAAMAWEGLDMVEKLKDKPMVAPLITAFLGVAASGVKSVAPAAHGMIGASMSELTGQVITKIKANKDESDSAKVVGGSYQLNGRLNAALQNPKLRAKFQQHMQNNPQFRNAITRKLNEGNQEVLTKQIADNQQCANELFALSLDAY